MPLRIKNIYLGKDQKVIMLLKIFQNHNDKVESLVGRDFAAGTFERDRTAKKHIEEFINKVYNVKDIRVKEVDHKFISGYDYY